MARPKRARRLRLASPAGACLFIAVLLAGLSDGGAARAQEFPLDRYPGFGRLPAAALRDNTIAYWEAFRREQLITRCMRSGGFEYSPVVGFPPHAMALVAEGLGVRASEVSSLIEPAERNRIYKESLSMEELDRYSRTHVGESAAEVSEADRSGMTPAGRGQDFATGGCFGQAAAAVPSVWETRRELSGAYDAMRRGVADSPGFAAARRKFTGCAERGAGILAAGPGDLEGIVARGGPEAAVATAALRECMSVWDEGYRHAEIESSEVFIEQNLAILAASERRYRGVMARIKEDEALRTYLGEEVGFANRAGTTARP